jgi:uncharacterized RDD family membrane protein YckC
VDPTGPVLVSGEGVRLALAPAGVGSRVIAAIIDGAIQELALLLLVLLDIALAGSADAAALGALIVIEVILVLAGYPIVSEWLSRGRTVGKLALGLRVVRDDGGPIGFRHALAPLPDWVPVQLQPWVLSLDMHRLDDRLALSARQFVTRAHAMSYPAQAAIGEELRRRLLAVTAPPPPAGTPTPVLLLSMLAERRRRAAEPGVPRQPPPTTSLLPPGPSLTKPAAAPVRTDDDGPFAAPT